MANVHSKEQREFIVRKLAGFEPPRAIVLDFSAMFPDTACDENDVKRLDQDSGAMLSPDLFTLFTKERERVLLDPSSAPYANQQARLIALSKDVKFHRSNNDLANARAVMRQIAEELGVIGGGKTAKGGKEAPGDAAEELCEITRTIVDHDDPDRPKPASDE